MSKKFKLLSAILLVTASLIAMLPATAEARYREVNAIIFNPTTDGGKFITVHESQTLQQWKFNAGVWGDFGYEPMEIRTAAGRQPVIDDLLVANVNGAVGFTDWFEAGVNVPIIAWETWADPDGTPPVKTSNKYGLGDVRLETKFRLLDIERYKVGIAVVPFVTFPTVTKGLQSQPVSTKVIASGWRNGKFVSNEDFTGGGKLVIEGNIYDRVWLALNTGYQAMRYRKYFAANPDAYIDDLFLLSGAAHVRINDQWSVIAEMYAETVAKNFFKSQRQTPVEAIGAVRWQPDISPDLNGLTFTLGGGRGVISRGVGASDFRIFTGINFRKPSIVELPPPPPPAEVEAKVTEKIIITQKIHFEFNKSNIRPISYPILDDVVELMKRNPSIKKIEVGGHCDWIGSDEYNLKLSQKRAQAVVDYLTSKGVERDRLVAKGYGESVPIADNNTTEGRAKNRRVEFTVLE